LTIRTVCTYDTMIHPWFTDDKKHDETRVYQLSDQYGLGELQFKSAKARDTFIKTIQPAPKIEELLRRPDPYEEIELGRKAHGLKEAS
jgi:hypothetical protein